MIATKLHIGGVLTRAELGEHIRAHLNASLSRLGTEVDLSDTEFARIESELAKIEIHGNRTDEDIAKLRNFD